MSLSLRKYLAEAIGTYLLIFCGTGSIIASELFPDIVNHAGIAMSFGLVVMVVVYSIGELSGAHINPAVSIGFWAAGKFPGKDVLPYIFAQSAGAVLASFSLSLLVQSQELGMTLPSSQISVGQAFGIEIILTYVLMFVIINVATGSKEVGIIAGIAIGGAVALDALFAGPLTGASMNPARSLGPALVSAEFTDQWIYLVAPVIGSLLAVGSWKILKPASNQ